jgi:hypothetical protein
VICGDLVIALAQFNPERRHCREKIVDRRRRYFGLPRNIIEADVLYILCFEQQLGRFDDVLEPILASALHWVTRTMHDRVRAALSHGSFGTYRKIARSISHWLFLLFRHIRLLAGWCGLPADPRLALVVNPEFASRS